MITTEQIANLLKTGKIANKINQKAAVLIPLVKVNNQLHLLFQVRSKTLKWQPSDICFPGGRVELGDINPEYTAKRETCEELGILPTQITILGKLPKFIANFAMTIYPFVGEIKSIDNLILNPDEVEEVFTVPLNWFMNNRPSQATIEIGHKFGNDFPFHLLPNRPQKWQKRSEHLVYFYQYKNYIIWGLTAQILNNFIHQIHVVV